jgi:protocatechuate 3,4-dioxygenase beta subunit
MSTPAHARARRRIVMALVAAPVALRGSHIASVSAAPLPAVACVLMPAMTDGPYFVDRRLNRSDLTAGTTRPGVVKGSPLLLNIDLASMQAAGCMPVAGAQVDVWHADAGGDYSDVSGGTVQAGTQEKSFLRGYQVSDANGRVTFRTIHPGWYPGRTIHIHVKVRLFNAAGNATYDFSTQLYFDDAASDAVMALAQYNARGPRTVRNSRDFIYGNNANAIVKLSAPADGSRGHVATVALGLQAPAPRTAANRHELVRRS